MQKQAWTPKALPNIFRIASRTKSTWRSFLLEIIFFYVTNENLPKIQAEETQLADTLPFLLNYGSSAQVDDVLMNEAGLCFFFVK